MAANHAITAEDSIDLSRVAFPGKVDYPVYRRLLQRSDAHVYLTYPFVASWSLREALAIGCAIIGSDTLRSANSSRMGIMGCWSHSSIRGSSRTRSWNCSRTSTCRGACARTRGHTPNSICRCTTTSRATRR